MNSSTQTLMGYLCVALTCSLIAYLLGRLPAEAVATLLFLGALGCGYAWYRIKEELLQQFSKERRERERTR